MKRQSNTEKILRYMKRLLLKGWTQGVSARSATGREVDVHSTAAARFCLLGARGRAVADLKIVGEARSLQLIEKCIPRGHLISTYNDAEDRTKADILRVIDCAIKKEAKTA